MYQDRGTHNHKISIGMKPEGECPECDTYHEQFKDQVHNRMDAIDYMLKGGLIKHEKNVKDDKELDPENRQDYHYGIDAGGMFGVSYGKKKYSYNVVGSVMIYHDGYLIHTPIEDRRKQCIVTSYDFADTTKRDLFEKLFGKKVNKYEH